MIDGTTNRAEFLTRMLALHRTFDGPSARWRAKKRKHRELATYLLVLIKIRLDSVKRMTKIQNTS